jgi:hypothetical protein
MPLFPSAESILKGALQENPNWDVNALHEQTYRFFFHDYLFN